MCGNLFHTNRTCFSVSANLLIPSWRNRIALPDLTISRRTHGLCGSLSLHRHRRHRNPRYRNSLTKAFAFGEFAFEIAHLRLAVGARARAVARMRTLALGQRDAVGIGNLPPHLLQDLACGFASGHYSGF